MRPGIAFAVPVGGAGSAPERFYRGFFGARPAFGVISAAAAVGMVIGVKRLAFIG